MNITMQEALNELKDSIKGDGYQCHKEVYEMAIVAMEKQIPKKTVKPESPYFRYACPSCGNYPLSRHYCSQCGQAIVYSKEGEG